MSEKSDTGILERNYEIFTNPKIEYYDQLGEYIPRTVEEAIKINKKKR